MSLKITHKYSTAAGTPPASGDIDVGELAINAADAELYTKDNAGNIRKFQNTTTGTADGVQFTQTGTGAVQRTVESKLQDVVSVKDFGAVGDGVADDTTAVTNAIASQRPLDWGGLSYKITSSISQTVTKPVQWYGNGATITYSGTHTGDAIFLDDTIGVKFAIENLTIDGSKLCNRVLRIENNTSNTTPSTFTANNLSIKRAKRLNTLSGGEAVFIRGAFQYVTFNDGVISDCELPAGQGTPGVFGIRGIGVTWYSTTSFVKRLTLNGVRIEKIYSSDLAYTDDQDGAAFFSPTESGSGKYESDFVAMGGCCFINCYGRSIKTQCRNTQVRDCNFQRTEGPAAGNGEISSQAGTCVVNACSFSYRNGKTPGNVVGPSTFSNWKAAATITDNEVDLDSSTTLPIFVLPFPSNAVDPWSQITVSRNRILGTVERFVDFLCNGEKNFLTIEDNWVEEIGIYSPTSTRCLVYTRTSGANAAYFAHLSLNRNIYAGANTVQLARDAVPGTAMRAMYSAYGNYGFENNWTASVENGSNTLQSFALPVRITDASNIAIEGQQRSYGYFGMQTKTAAASATVTFNFRANNCSLIILQVSSERTAYALFTADSSITTISSGTGLTMGTTTNPAGANTFNVWRSNSGEISVENATTTSRQISVWVFAPN